MALPDILMDSYDRRARLEPAFVVLIPAGIAVVLSYPELESTAGSVVALFAYLGGLRLLSQLARDRGRRQEGRLFQLWGGKPSVALLRYRDSRLPRATKERYRAWLAQRVPDLRLPSERQERDNPLKADAAYDSVTGWLLAKTRDHSRYPLLFKENKNYGFRRNLWGLKPTSLALDAVLLLGLIGSVLYRWENGGLPTLADVSVAVWLCFGVALLHFAMFATVITPRWVRLPAEAYALRLLEVCDTEDTPI